MWIASVLPTTPDPTPTEIARMSNTTPLPVSMTLVYSICWGSSRGPTPAPKPAQTTLQPLVIASLPYLAPFRLPFTTLATHPPPLTRPRLFAIGGGHLWCRPSYGPGRSGAWAYQQYSVLRPCVVAVLVDTLPLVCCSETLVYRYVWCCNFKLLLRTWIVQKFMLLIMCYFIASRLRLQFTLISGRSAFYSSVLVAFGLVGRL